MDSLVINSSMSSKATEIKEYIVQFYNQLHSKQYTWRPKVSFWHDVWCEDSPLKISYLDLFSIAQRKDAWVANNLQF
jgi:hypothetical protein